MVGLRCFLLRPTKKFSLQNGEKTEVKNWTLFLDKNAPMRLHMSLSTLIFFIFFSSFFSFLWMLPLFLFFFLLIYRVGFVHV